MSNRSRKITKNYSSSYSQKNLKKLHFGPSVTSKDDKEMYESLNTGNRDTFWITKDDVSGNEDIIDMLKEKISKKGKKVKKIKKCKKSKAQRKKKSVKKNKKKPVKSRRSEILAKKGFLPDHKVKLVFG